MIAVCAFEYLIHINEKVMSFSVTSTVNVISATSLNG